MLHISVGRVGKTLLPLARSVELNQVARDVLDLVFRPFFQPFPRTTTEFGYRRRRAFAAFVLRDTMQVMDAHENSVSVAIRQPNHLLRLTVDSRCYQAAKLTDSVVAMYHIITQPQLVNLLQCQDRFAATRILRTQTHTMVTLEDLVVRIATNLCFVVHESCVQRLRDRSEMHRLAVVACCNIFKDRL